MKVSIIVPVYNVTEYVEKCMDSVVSQTFRDFEVILVDDCGTDDSVLKAENVLSHKEVNYKLIHHDFNRGLSAARNTGLANAVGEYVYFLDSDDSITSDCIQLLVDSAEKNNALMVLGGIDVVGNDENIPLLYNRKTFYQDNQQVFRAYLSGEFYMMAWNKLIRRDFLLNNHIEFVEGLIHEDNPWSFEIACKLNSLAVVNKPTYNYLVRENSIQTDKNYNKHFVAYKTILRELAHIAQHNNKLDQVSFVEWFERQKALFFGQTVMKGSKRRQMDMYGQIRNLLPVYRFTKSYLHYFFPSFIGFYIYKKFFGYHLC